MRKKWTILCIILITVLMLTACQEAVNDGTSESGSQELTDSAATEEVLVAEKQEMPVVENGMRDIQLLGNTLYYSTYLPTEDGEDILNATYRQIGNEDPQLFYTCPDQTQSLASCVDQQGNGYSLYRNNTDDLTYLGKWDADGNAVYAQVSETYAHTIVQEGTLDCAVGDDGVFYLLTTRGTLLLWDEQGLESRTISAGWDETQAGGLVNAGTQGIYFYTCDRNQVNLSSLSLTSGLSQPVTLEVPCREDVLHTSFDATDDWIKLFCGYEQGIFLIDQYQLWQYDPATAQLEECMTWADEYINLSAQDLQSIVREQDTFRLLTYDRSSQLCSRVEVTQRRREEIPNKETILLGCKFSANLEPLVIEYNEQSDQYYVQLVTYRTRDAGGSRVEELDLELLKGEGPDLIDLSTYSMDFYASKGILDDLSTYMGSDSRIQAEDLLPSALQALEIDGTLYGITPSFLITGLIVPAEYAQDGALSTEAFLQMVEDHPDSYLGIYGNYTNYLSLLLRNDINSYVDWQGQTCSFDSESFITLLDTVCSWKETPSEVATELMSLPTSELLYQQHCLYESVTFYSTVPYLHIRDGFDDTFVLSGLPNAAGEEKYDMTLPYLFGINSASQHKEGAWDFIEYLLLQTLESTEDDMSGFPILTEAFESFLDRQPYDENDKRVVNSYTWEEGEPPQMTEEDVARIRELVEHLTYQNFAFNPIHTIIYEETPSVFAGEKDAATAAEIIQSRALLLLNE